MTKRPFYSEHLVGVRMAKGWSPAELAKKCGFKAQSTISRLESGKRKNPGSFVLGRLCEALEIASDYLIGKRHDLDGCSSFRKATACLTLETFVARHSISDDDERTLRRIAEEHTSPPVFVEAWANLHKSLTIAGAIPPSGPTGQGRSGRRTLRARRLQPAG